MESRVIGQGLRSNPKGLDMIETTQQKIQTISDNV